MYGAIIIIISFLSPRDAMRKRGLCCRPVSVFVTFVFSCIVFERLKISSNKSSIILVF